MESKPNRNASIDTVIPDCCNIGVIFRTLVAVNVVVLAAIFATTGGWMQGLSAFVESSILVELICLSSLFVLCGLRSSVRATPAWAQRMVCPLVPAVITALIFRFLTTLELFSTGRVTIAEGAAIAALFGLALQHYFELRTRAFSPALVEAQLQALQARIRPHFLFNSLNAVLSLIRTEPKRAETALEDLADLFRVLMRDARDMTTLEEELHLCRQYLSIEKIRLGDRLQVEWHTTNISDSMLRVAQVPALLLQPLIENAVHYGVEPALEPVLIRIHLGRFVDRIEISIINPLHQASTSIDTLINTGNKIALDNIRQRLALLYDVEAQLTTTAVQDSFEVRLRFPYVKVDS